MLKQKEIYISSPKILTLHDVKRNALHIKIYHLCDLFFVNATIKLHFSIRSCVTGLHWYGTDLRY